MLITKKKEKEVLRALDQALLIKDFNIEKRFRDLKNFNEGPNNDDDDDNIGQFPGPLQYSSSSSRRNEPSLQSTLPTLPGAPLNAAQRFLLCLQKVAEVIGHKLTATRPLKITLSNKIKKYFLTLIK